jgi:hypothetical protein
MSHTETRRIAAFSRGDPTTASHPSGSLPIRKGHGRVAGSKPVIPQLLEPALGCRQPRPLTYRLSSESGSMITTRPHSTATPVGLYRADSEAELDGVLRALPLCDWMHVTATLEPHADDPAALQANGRRP